MGKNSTIVYTTHTFNPWRGCTKVGDDCAACFAEALAKRAGLDIWGPRKPRLRTSAANWKQPLKWNEEAVAAGERHRVLGTMFDWADTKVPNEWREDLFALIRATPNLDWLLLTKRPHQARAYIPEDWFDYEQGYPNVWLGLSAGRQDYLERRAIHHLAIPSVCHWLSYEPALGPLDVTGFLGCEDEDWSPSLTYGFKWVVAGCEQAGKARRREMDLDWIRDVRDQVKGAGAAFIFKQAYENGKIVNLPTLDGKVWNEYPKVDGVGHG